MWRYHVFLTYSLLIHFNQPMVTEEREKTTVCYYRNWAQYYHGKAKFLPEDIDPHLCSVVNYAAMEVNLTSYQVQGRQPNDEEMLRRINNLKKKNPKLLVFIMVGGWNHERKPRFSHMVKNKTTRSIFISSVLKYISKHNLDGINIDWEYPTFRGSPIKDSRKFTHLLKELSAAFRAHSLATSTPGYHITLAVSASPKKILRAYQIKKLVKYVDWINIMAYNLWGPWKRRTGCPTLMKGGHNTVPRAVRTWLKRGMPAEKINLGMTTYGKTYLLQDAESFGVGSECFSGGGFPGRYTKKAGILSYYEICSTKWNHVTGWAKSSCGTPYASYLSQWVAYDDVHSIRAKVRELVNGLSLNGVSFWALDFDDFTGSNCGQGKYPLIKAAVDEMKTVPMRSLSQNLHNSLKSRKLVIDHDSVNSGDLITMFRRYLVRKR